MSAGAKQRDGYMIVTNMLEVEATRMGREGVQTTRQITGHHCHQRVNDKFHSLTGRRVFSG